MNFNPFKIGNIEIKTPLVLSPMSGITTFSFRKLIRELNEDAVGLFVSEFVSVEALTRKVQRSFQMMRFSQEERPFCVQIFGYDVERMCEAALMVQDAGVDIVEINCGCPAPKVIKKGGGCELMRQPGHLKVMLARLRKALSIPLSIKIRAGWDMSSRNAIEIASMAESEGVDAVAIHGRTRTQYYRGQADWDLVAELVQALKIPVLGSGDVRNREDALKRFEQSNVAALCIGRGTMANPVIFREIISGEKAALKDNPLRVLDILERYIVLLKEEFDPRVWAGKIKQLVSRMAKGYRWRKEICQAVSFEEIVQIIQRVRSEVEQEHAAS